jgi:hypothetical protein
MRQAGHTFATRFPFRRCIVDANFDQDSLRVSVERDMKKFVSPSGMWQLIAAKSFRVSPDVSSSDMAARPKKRPGVFGRLR